MISGVDLDEPRAARAASVELLFVQQERRLGAFLVQLVRDRSLAEDLLQETFLEAHRHADRLAEADDQVAWLFGVARKRALAALRRSRRLQSALGRLTGRSAPEETLTPPQTEVLDVLDRVLGAEDRALVVLRYVHGFDAPALAAMTGRTPAAIRKRLERCCARLAEVIER